MLPNFTEKDLHGRVHIFEQDLDRESFNNSNKPNDIHLVDYILNSQHYCDAARSYKMVDVFDVYHDKIKSLDPHGKVTKITSGHGSINPKLHGYQNKNKDKDKES